MRRKRQRKTNPAANFVNVNEITIAVTGHLAMLPADVAERVAPALIQTIQRFSPGGVSGVYHETEHIAHCFVGEDGALVLPAGLLGRVKTALAEQGFRVNIDETANAAEPTGKYR